MSRLALSLSVLLMASCAQADETEAAPSGQAAEGASQDADRVVATWEGGQLTLADLQDEIAGQLRQAEVEYKLQRYELVSQAAESAMIEKLLEAEVARLGLADIDALLAAEVEAKVTLPTDAEVAAFYAQVERQLGGASLQEAHPYLVQDMVRRAQGERFQAYLGELKTARGASIDLPYPDLPRVEVAIGENDPVRGALDAPVTIVQYAEYQCPFCYRVTPTLDRLLEEYDGKVRVVFKDYPLPNHSRAQPAAVAAHCAGDQGKYWEMNATLLANQSALGDQDFLGYAKDLGLDAGAFQTCLTSGRFDASIAADFEEAQRVGVSATPTFFINGIYLAGAQPFERFKKLVDQELANN